MPEKKPFWDKKAPSGVSSKHLSKSAAKSAKARAKSAGRPYPNLVDNVAAARASKNKR